jgi:cytochrome P450
LESNTSDDEKSTPRLIDEAMVLTIAGTDTTASTLSALTFHVLNDVTIFRRLREELETVMPDAGQSPDPAKLSTLPYLNALIEETLRLYPSGTHRQDRVAPNDDLIFTHPDGKQSIIPAGTIIGMTAPLLNRHPDWYADADKFHPERYLDDPKLLRRHLTFSKGGRQCLGINLAYQELQMFTAGIFRKYKAFDKSAVQQDGPTLELYDTTIEDIKLHADYVSPGLRPGSCGVRVRVRHS